MTPASPWAAIAGPVPPPRWDGPVRVHVLLDEPAPAYAAEPAPKVQRQAAKPRSDRRELLQLQRRAQAAVLRVLPAWSQIEPGSAKEALMLQAPATWWWPRG